MIDCIERIQALEGKRIVGINFNGSIPTNVYNHFYGIFFMAPFGFVNPSVKAVIYFSTSQYWLYSNNNVSKFDMQHHLIESYNCDDLVSIISLAMKKSPSH